MDHETISKILDIIDLRGESAQKNFIELAPTGRVAEYLKNNLTFGVTPSAFLFELFDKAHYYGTAEGQNIACLVIRRYQNLSDEKLKMLQELCFSIDGYSVVRAARVEPVTASALRLFISYSHEDEDFVRWLSDELETKGAYTTYDRHKSRGLRGGVRWTKALEERIAGSTHILFIVTPASARSDFVEKELLHAQARGIPIIPLELCKTESSDIPIIVTDLQRIEMFDNREEGLNKLLRDLTEGQ